MPGARPVDVPPLPAALCPVSRTLRDAGATAWWVGAPLLEWIDGRRPAAFDLTTDASADRIAELFAHAVPTANGCGTLVIPTPVGPVDATPYAFGRDIAHELAHRDFTVHALAYDEGADRLLDPCGGLADLAAGRLRAVGSAAERIGEDPVRALRALRLVATRGLKPDPELDRALPLAAAQLPRAPRTRVREALAATLTSNGVGQAWPLFEASGLMRALAPTARPGAAALLAQLPNDLEIRLAAWLRGARARRTLQALRFCRPVVLRVEHLLALHPIDRVVDPSRHAAVARLARRESRRDLEALLLLRRVELRVEGGAAAADRARVDALEAAVAEARAQQTRRAFRLALDGSDVMRELGCGPGRTVGRALAHLKRCVESGETANDAAALRAALRAWSDAGG